VWFFVDAIQGLGVLPFDLDAMRVDAVAGGGHKWLLGPVGHGFLALREGRRAELQPIAVGAMSYGTPDDPVDPARPLRDDPRRFEPGNPLLFTGTATAAAAAHLLDVGVARVGAAARVHARRVVDLARARGLRVLSSLDRDDAAPIATFVPRNASAVDVARALRARDVIVVPRAGGIRVSPHAWHGDDEIDRFFAIYDEVVRALA
jgi:selenocysteine lyase/cysteine desulfurase